MKPLAILGLLALAGCGANGDPLRPTTSGSVTIGTGGASVATNTSVTSGGVTLGLGLGQQLR